MCTFFLARPIWMIFMDKKAQAYTFWAKTFFFEKRVKRGTYRNFCKICPKLKKSQFFVKFQYSVPFLPFFTLLLRNGLGNLFSISNPFLGRKTLIKSQKSTIFWKFEKMLQNSQKWSYCVTKIFNYVYLFFGSTNLDDIYGQEGPSTYLLGQNIFFWKKGKKGYL
jgi:hypothetical protein